MTAVPLASALLYGVTCIQAAKTPLGFYGPLLSLEPVEVGEEILTRKNVVTVLVAEGTLVC